MIKFKVLNKQQQYFIYKYNAYIYHLQIYFPKQDLIVLLDNSDFSEVEKEEIKLYIKERGESK